MNPHTGEVRPLAEVLHNSDFVPISSGVAQAQLEGQRVLATRALRKMRKVERQNRKAGRPR